MAHTRHCVLFVLLTLVPHADALGCTLHWFGSSGVTEAPRINMWMVFRIRRAPEGVHSDDGAVLSADEMLHWTVGTAKIIPDARRQA